jgi:hypothetical protein
MRQTKSFGEHFIQLQSWYVIVAYGMFGTFFIASMALLGKYRSLFSI